MKITRDEFGEIHVEVTIEDVRKAARKFKMSPELRKMIEDHRREIVDAAMAMSREKSK